MAPSSRWPDMNSTASVGHSSTSDSASSTPFISGMTTSVTRRSTGRCKRAGHRHGLDAVGRRQHEIAPLLELAHGQAAQLVLVLDHEHQFVATAGVLLERAVADVGRLLVLDGGEPHA